MSTPTGAYCPHCGAEYIAEPCDGDSRLITYWGEGETVAVYCHNEECEQEFEIREYVTRTWEAVVPVVGNKPIEEGPG